MTPLSGRTFLEAYYDLQASDTQFMLAFIKNLEPFSLVTTQALEDTWPDAGWKDAESTVQDPTAAITSKAEDLSINDTVQQSTTLRDRTFDQLAERIVAGEDIGDEGTLLRFQASKMPS